MRALRDAHRAATVYRRHVHRAGPGRVAGAARDSGRSRLCDRGGAGAVAERALCDGARLCGGAQAAGGDQLGAPVQTVAYVGSGGGRRDARTRDDGRCSGAALAPCRSRSVAVCSGAVRPSRRRRAETDQRRSVRGAARGGVRPLGRRAPRGWPARSRSPFTPRPRLPQSR